MGVVRLRFDTTVHYRFQRYRPRVLVCVSALPCEGFISVDVRLSASICVRVREAQSTVEKRNRPELPGRSDRRMSLPATALGPLVSNQRLYAKNA